ncbi:hypothetical protein GQX73_g5511 [Xylaria multiplex]|uniref:Uncharacterized protein n=1 Tax=Xylaria multiplex TaxID=323545 RepID=A0A7C8J0K8_9PEZI|nr:hypothetical protein GQX73_g5511 [Xylaria multiplex]
MSNERNTMDIDRKTGNLKNEVQQNDKLLHEISSDLKDIKLYLSIKTQAPSDGSDLPHPLPSKRSNTPEIYRERNAHIRALETALEDARKRLGEESRKVTTLQDQIIEKDREVANYKRMIVRSGRREEGPNDNQISGLFVRLKSEIVRFSMTCLPGGIRVPHSEGTSPEIGDLLMRAKVANLVFLSFFSPSAGLFGHFDTMNDATLQNSKGNSKSPYQQIERSFNLAKRDEIITEDELKDWRIMTVNLARKVSGESDQYSVMQAEDIWKRLVYEHSVATSKRGGYSNQPPGELIELCKTAYNIALIFRSSRIEYSWKQTAKATEVQPHEAEILGTTGASQLDPHCVEKIIFGEVIRGNRNTGKLGDGSTRLLKASVVIGCLERKASIPSDQRSTTPVNQPPDSMSGALAIWLCSGVVTCLISARLGLRKWRKLALTPGDRWLVAVLVSNGLRVMGEHHANKYGTPLSTSVHYAIGPLPEGESNVLVLTAEEQDRLVLAGKLTIATRIAIIVVYIMEFEDVGIGHTQRIATKASARAASPLVYVGYIGTNIPRIDPIRLSRVPATEAQLGAISLPRKMFIQCVMDNYLRSAIPPDFAA